MRLGFGKAEGLALGGQGASLGRVFREPYKKMSLPELAVCSLCLCSVLALVGVRNVRVRRWVFEHSSGPIVAGPDACVVAGLLMGDEKRSRHE